jgi:transposase
MISVGIDVSKERSTVCILKPYGEVFASPYVVEHTEQEVGKLATRILSLDGEVKVVMEATGADHLPMLISLKQAGIFVSVINPLAMKKYASIAIRKRKTDKLDAVRIANYGIDNWFRLTDYSAPEEIYNELKVLGRQYAHYISIKVAGKLALANLLDRTMPGIKKLVVSTRSEEPTKDKLGDFVEEYWHYDNILKKSESRFVGDYCRWAKKKGSAACTGRVRRLGQRQLVYRFCFRQGIFFRGPRVKVVFAGDFCKAHSFLAVRSNFHPFGSFHFSTLPALLNKDRKKCIIDHS